MNTPTPRPALKATGMRRRYAPCLETELAALTAERDQLRAEVKSCGELSCDECNARTAALTAERDQLRAEVERLRSDRDCEKRLRKDADEFRENAIARADRAEDNLAALEQSFDDNCRGVVKIADELATERAIVSRIWTQLGSPTYAQLKGRSIYDLIDELKADYDLIDELKAELATERGKLDWVFQNCKVEANDYTTGNRDVYYVHDREDLGVAMKEDAK